MKHRSNLHFLAVTSSAFFLAAAASGLDIPGADGTDGMFNPTSNTVIDLSQAVVAAWDTDNSAAPGKGVYDSDKWAVVFKYSSVNVPAGVTVSFKNNASHAPVVWLVKSNITISGTLNLNGVGPSATAPGEPGPGGFRGSFKNGIGLIAQAGYGPGGGANEQPSNYGVPGISPTAYGNNQILPLIGGSGAGRQDTRSIGGNLTPGGSGGGAILIAANETIRIDGKIQANGSSANYSRSGSGGAVRVIGEQVLGNGSLEAQNGNVGRIRVETPTFSGSLRTFPSTVVVSPDNPVLIWPTTDAPFVQLLSVAGLAVPTDPKARLDLPGADVAIQSTNQIQIVILTRNFGTNSRVTARVVPHSGNSFSVQATHASGDTASSTWTVGANFPSGYAAIQVRAVSP